MIFRKNKHAPCPTCGQRFDPIKARAATLALFPAIGRELSPENHAFVAYSKKHGEPEAHRNIYRIMSGVYAQMAKELEA